MSWIAIPCPVCRKLVEIENEPDEEGRAVFVFSHCGVVEKETGGQPKDADANSDALTRLTDRLHYDRKN